jgi:hypothetical protein
MVNIGSLPQSVQSVFDYDSQTGITHILASIRAAEIGSDQKNELRDLVFLYSSNNMDQRVRATLEQKVVAYGLKPVPKKTTKADKKSLPEQPTIGKFRTAPTFNVPQGGSLTVVISPVPDFTKDATWQKATPPAQASEPVPQPVPDLNQVESPVAPPTIETPELVVKKTPPQVQVYPESPAPLVDSQEDALQRIREIKSLVNSKVGNPVNLVDINNEVGREYMSALLDAMKKINSGSSATSAMSRLENAYAAVEKTLAGVDIGQPILPKPVAIETQSISTPEVNELVQQIPLAPVEPEYEPIPPTPPVVKKPVPISQTPADVDETAFGKINITSSRLPEVNESEMTVASIQPEIDDSVETTPRPTIPAVYRPAAAPAVSGFDTGRPSASISLQAPVATNAVKPLATLADLSQLVNSAAPQPKQDTTLVGGDPLQTPEVNMGLAQLLEEWPIFKKSGLFGTGPKGIEHPLFKKMATLQIPLLLAGRFEGATQEIKQSVTDYMNGWRYEQGLIYEQGETFEHYLRRVIRHILDLQKSKL